MANSVQLGRVPLVGYGRLAAANTAGDGSGTLVTVLTIPWKSVKVANIAASASIVIQGWSRISNDKLGNITVGDIVNLLAGTSLTGIALATDYTVSEITVVSATDVATIKLVDSSFAELTITATNPVFGFNVGGRVELAQYTPSQATKASVPAKIVSLYARARNGSARKLSDITIATVTPSTTVAATVTTLPIAQAFQSGDAILASQTVYAGVQDQGDLIVNGSQY
jgi:hypothetical protein